MQTISVIGLLMLTTACTDMTATGGATEKALCIAWGESLPTRSRADTKQTQDEIQRGYAVFAAACTGYKDLIP